MDVIVTLFIQFEEKGMDDELVLLMLRFFYLTYKRLWQAPQAVEHHFNCFTEKP